MENSFENEMTSSKIEFLNRLFQNNLHIMSDDEARRRDMEIAEREAVERERNKQRRFESSGVGERYWTERIENFKAYNHELKNNLAVVKEFIADLQLGKSRALWMCGTNGNGKTMLAAMAIRECGGRFVKMYELMSAYYAKYKDVMDIVKPLAKSKLVVVDEIECVDENEYKVIFPLVNEVYESLGSIILIANANKNDFGAMLGKPIIDRFYENCVTLEFTSESWRKRNRNAQGVSVTDEERLAKVAK